MGTAADIVNRVYREYLQRPNDQPIRLPLSADLAVGATSVNLDRTILEEEEDALLTSPGTLIEVDQELLSVRSDTGSGWPDNQPIQVAREQEGTTDVAHDSAALVTVAPVWSRMSVFDAVADSVSNLYPDVWHTKTFPVVTGRVIELDADVTQLLEFRYRSGDLFVQGSADLLVDHPNVASQVAVQFPNMPTGRSGYVKCRARFTRPTEETSDVGDLEPDWVQLVVVGAVVNLAAQTDLDEVQSEILTHGLEAQNWPVGSGERVSRAAIRQYEYHLSKAKQELKVKYRIPTAIGGVTYGGS